MRLLPLTLFCVALGCSLQTNHWRSSSVVIDRPPLPAVAATDEPVAPLPLQIEGLNLNKVALGQQLFEDPRLSADNTVSCASCHDLQLGGADQLRVSIGIGGAMGTLNSPTVFNSAFNFRQFWDGRVESLEAQIDGPIHNTHEMGSSWPEVINKLQQVENYRLQFHQIYGQTNGRNFDPVDESSSSQQVVEITPDTIRDAIATYERSLTTPNAPFDQYLRGNLQVLTPDQKAGYARFKTYGCISCHQGINIGGNMFQRFGIFGNYYEDRQDLHPEDFGRYNVTGDERDRYVFKVPSLRNVALTSPYLHDGSVQNLADVVAIMGQYQLGRFLTQDDIDTIVQFLTSLTGEAPIATPQEQRP